MDTFHCIVDTYPLDSRQGSRIGPQMAEYCTGASQRVPEAQPMPTRFHVRLTFAHPAWCLCAQFLEVDTGKFCRSALSSRDMATAVPGSRRRSIRRIGLIGKIFPNIPRISAKTKPTTSTFARWLSPGKPFLGLLSQILPLLAATLQCAAQWSAL